MSKLSIIVPYCNEYPQVYFTVCGIRCELERSEIDWEIVTVANKSTDKGFERLWACRSNRVVALEYNERQSHWNAKNWGVLHSTGDVLFFIDGHCILTKDALVNMFNFFVEHEEELCGTLHLPILYMNEQNGRELEYKLVANITDDVKIVNRNPKNTPHTLTYVFTRYKYAVPYHRVSAMSTCGMMISRKLLVDELGVWPVNMGAYGGGENFINFTLGMMGYYKNVYHTPYVVHHYAEKRGYIADYDGQLKNRIIAAYIYGGEEWAYTFAINSRGRRAVIEKIYSEVIIDQKPHRDHILPKIKYTPQEWVEQEAICGRMKEVYK